jgi:hypothetical protein
MRVDHSFVSVMTLVNPGFRIPIVPVMQNCNTPPQPSLRRSYDIGKRLSDVLATTAPGRVVAIGTGGLSHWVGSAERRAFFNQQAGTRLPQLASCPPLQLDATGPINDAFDRDFLGLLEEGGAQRFAEEWTPARLEDVAGNGAQELRNWLLVAALSGDRPAEVLAYEPVAEWLTGMGIVSFSLT